MKSVRIGNGAGFWGDQLDAPRMLVESGELDYLTLEYLAELTMSILSHLRSKDPALGYVPDLIPVIESLVPFLKQNQQLKIITNGGGLNPRACASRISQILTREGLGEVSIGVVEGDDLLPGLGALKHSFTHFDTGEPLTVPTDQIVCANAYLGSEGIVETLSAGARIVITGRVADASLTVGPARYHFGWPEDAWGLLAQATVAGHLIECGAQVTGGMCSSRNRKWKLDNIGYPIAVIQGSGHFFITKPPRTDGAVTRETVSEQLVYEIGDPQHYLTPDVDADFSQVRLEELDPDHVMVLGATGRKRPDRYKVSMAYRAGYMVSNTLTFAGKDCVSHAQEAAEIIKSRLNRAGLLPQSVDYEVLGIGIVEGSRSSNPPDQVPGRGNHDQVVLRMAASDPDKSKLERFMREFPPLVASGPAGVTGYTGPRASPHPVMAYWPTTIARELVPIRTQVQAASQWSLE